MISSEVSQARVSAYCVLETIRGRLDSRSPIFPLYRGVHPTQLLVYVSKPKTYIATSPTLAAGLRPVSHNRVSLLTPPQGKTSSSPHSQPQRPSHRRRPSNQHPAPMTKSSTVRPARAISSRPSLMCPTPSSSSSSTRPLAPHSTL